MVWVRPCAKNKPLGSIIDWSIPSAGRKIQANIPLHCLKSYLKTTGNSVALQGSTANDNLDNKTTMLNESNSGIVWEYYSLLWNTGKNMWFQVWIILMKRTVGPEGFLPKVISIPYFNSSDSLPRYLVLPQRAKT